MFIILVACPYHFLGDAGMEEMMNTMCMCERLATTCKRSIPPRLLKRPRRIYEYISMYCACFPQQHIIIQGTMHTRPIFDLITAVQDNGPSELGAVNVDRIDAMSVRDQAAESAASQATSEARTK